MTARCPEARFYDATRERRFCGEGDYDIAGFIAAVRQAGYTGPWAVEVFSKELLDWPLSELSRRSFATTMSQLTG